MKFWHLNTILLLFSLGCLCRISAQPIEKPVPPPAAIARASLPKFEVYEYRFEGETILPPQQLSNILSNYTGDIDLGQLYSAIDNLGEFYWLNDITNVSVVLPRQSITNGIVRVQIVPRTFTAGASAKPAPTLTVRGYLVEGNTVLPPESFGVLSNYCGTNLDFARLRAGLGQVQLLYREYGYSTINVAFPSQRPTNGIIRVKVIEGRLSDIRVTGNRWFSEKNIRRALPGLTTNILLNNKWFQPELDLANANRDRQIYPVISPGPDPGTTALELKVKDQLPLHGRMELNNKSTPDSPLLRLDTAIQYNNLWQLDHQVGFDYNFSPQEMKSDGSVSHFYDRPLVASYSAFYRMPLGFNDGTRQKVESEPANFGFDEATHKFNLPPPTGHPDFTLYASRSVSDTPVRFGPLSVIFTNSLAHISSQSASLSQTIDENIGGRFNFPLREFSGIHSTFSLGADFKSYEAPTFSTNLTYFQLYGLDAFGNPVLVTNSTIRLSSNTRAELSYIPLTYGWSGARPDPWGSWSFNYSQSIFLQGLASARTNFQIVALAPGAGGNYTTINAGLIRNQKLLGGWNAVVNLNGQWASAPLISNEQFALGGTVGVRGYEQGEIYGDDGWRVLCDLRAPAVNVGYFPTTSGDVPATLYPSLFMDYGQAYLIDRPVVGTLSYSQWGTGFGFFLAVGEHFDARLSLGWALLSTPSTQAGDLRAYFSVGAQF